MAKKSTKIKKYAFLAGKAGAVGLLFCGIFWTAAAAFLICVIGALRPFWVIAEVVCAGLALAFYVGAFIAWKQFGRLAEKNKKQEQQEDEMELERDFVLVVCPKCSGDNKIRRGTVVKCSYCDTYISGE